MAIVLMLCGIIGGVIGGMGMGGGTLLIPILVGVLGYDQQAAQCINLVSFIPMSVIALIVHCKSGLLKARGIWRVIVPALLTVVPSSIIAQCIDSNILGRFFGVFLAAMGGFSLINSIKNK